MTGALVWLLETLILGACLIATVGAMLWFAVELGWHVVTGHGWLEGRE